MSRLRRWLMAGTSLAGEIRRDEGGVVVIMTVVALGMFFGLAALVVDAGRLFNLHSQIQWYADHVALAAAAELDGEAGAIGRAIEAATGLDGTGPLIEDVQNFATDGAGANLQVARLVFLSELGDDPPPGDTDRPAGDVIVCITGGADFGDCQPEDDARARFVEVTVEPRTMNFFMLPVLRVFGVAEAATEGAATAQATAGFTREVCNFPPMMLCNPYETESNKAFARPDGQSMVGQQIRLRSLSPGAGLAPGNFALLDTLDEAGPPECSGPPQSPQRIACVLAAVEPQTSCVSATINTRPGQATPIYHGINARFDIWGQGTVSNLRDNFNFRPSANVTRGMRWTGNNPNQCRYAHHEAEGALTRRLPRDDCFGDASGGVNTCDRQKFGDFVSQSAMQDYWNENHPGTAYPGFNTRYEMYRYEIDNDMIPNRFPDEGGENADRVAFGTDYPRCSPHQGVNNPNRDRRNMIVAVVNCEAEGISGSVDDVPVIAFAEFFITEPITPPGGGEDSADLFIEMLGVAEPGGEDGVLHDFPQLYR